MLRLSQSEVINLTPCNVSYPKLWLLSRLEEFALVIADLAGETDDMKEKRKMLEDTLQLRDGYFPVLQRDSKNVQRNERLIHRQPEAWIQFAMILTTVAKSHWTSLLDILLLYFSQLHSFAKSIQESVVFVSLGVKVMEYRGIFPKQRNLAAYDM